MVDVHQNIKDLNKELEKGKMLADTMNYSVMSIYLQNSLNKLATIEVLLNSKFN
jgi:hypothetical protein